MPSKNTVIAVVAGAAIVGGTVAFFTFKRVRFGDVVNTDEDAFNVREAPTVSTNGQKDLNSTLTAKTDEKVLSNPKVVDSSDILLNETLRDIELQSSTTKSGVLSGSQPAKKVISKDVGRREEFPLLGISLNVPDGWEIREDPSPFPNVAMLTVWNRELVPENPQLQETGAVPMIVLTVEDIRGDCVNLLEFKERCKKLALEQMLMMTGGAIQPKITKDKSVKEGDFRYALEYLQLLPPYYELVVSNLLEVRSGVAYTFQIMCAPSVLPKYSSVFTDIARSVSIGDINTVLGYTEVCTGAVKVNIDTTWSWEFGKDNVLAVFTTTSEIKPEEIRLYKEDQVPVSVCKPRSRKIVNEVEVVSAYDGNQEEKVLTYNGYTLVVKPLQKMTSYLNEGDLVEVIRSVTSCTDSPKPNNGATFVNPEHGYQVDVVGGSRLVASRIGGGSVIYAPRGIKPGMMENERSPTVTIRIGSPENDPDCMETLQEWKERMQEEAKESEIKDICETVINGEPCLTFTTNVMEEVAPGQRSEVRGKIFIFVRDRKTTLLRWEMAAGLWRTYREEMNGFMDSLKFI